MIAWKCLRAGISPRFASKSISRLITCKTKWKPWKPAIYSFSTTTSTSSNNTIGELMNHWRQRFEEAGIPEPIESIEHITAHVIGTSKITDLVNLKEKKLDAEQINKLDTLCDCRLLRMPVQYIIGEWDFRDINLKLVPPVFIPRPETEILVDIVLKAISSMALDKYEILEIGCGSGAISLALAKSCKKVDCVAIDTNIEACNLALMNAQRLHLKQYVHILNATLKEDGTINIETKPVDNFDCNLNIKEQFDFIISNPPYIPTKKIFKLEPEIKIFEDIKALDGGDDGLKVIKPMLKYASSALKPGGRIFFEVDPVHPEYIQFFTKKYVDLKLQYGHTYKDFCNNERFVEVLKLK